MTSNFAWPTPDRYIYDADPRSKIAVVVYPKAVKAEG